MISIKKKSGLGLPITKRIIEAHDWKIEIPESENTEFSITLLKKDVLIKSEKEKENNFKNYIKK
ncbi:MAG: hypothetical protein ACW981_17260 [Candidatus Hodarchaeales archaeon]|jgi:nitrogen-specific signal transduction histidine kinase